jgi:PIN domain
MAVAVYLRSQPTGVHTAVMPTGPGDVVLDTNVFVAAGFNPGSHSARLVEAVRDGRLRMVWNDATHAEIEHVMPDPRIVMDSYRGPVLLRGQVRRFDAS